MWLKRAIGCRANPGGIVIRNKVTRLLPVALGFALSPFAACSCGPVCGPGTQLVDNECQPVGQLVCGAGTVAQDGSCVPEGEALQCGAGTVAQNGECVPENPLVCAAGTTEINGECRPDVTCGPGTEAQQGVCLPIGEFTPEPAAVSLTLPYDAAPSPDGTQIYYTAAGSDGETHSLWVVAFDGSTPAQELATGFIAPLGIAVASDGGTVFVGDSGEDDADDDNLTGAIYAVDAAGGAATRIDGTAGFEVKGIDLIDNNGTDEITFTGIDPADGAAGLFALVGNTVTTIAKGAPFSDPSGVAVASNGRRYVVDTTAGADGNGTVILVDENDAATVFLPDEQLRTGYPAGTALSLDEATLFVSGLAQDNSALVYAIDIATQNVTTVNAGLQGNDEAGGLHRAKDSDNFAWAGVTTVYGISFQ
jgi:DNA-binding beta-propeller fold protein YncE